MTHIQPIDGHVHIITAADIPNMPLIRERLNASHMTVISVFNKKEVNNNPACYAAKASYPDWCYVGAGLDHSAYLSGGTVSTPTLVEQVDRMVAIGADGMKLLETKPTERRVLDIPIDSDYYDAMFARIEELGLPMVWHVADPDEFWNPDTTPDWAKANDWGYHPTDVTPEMVYAEVANVLKRHPKLKVIFAHFFFMSKHLPEAAELFDTYPGVHFDLTPGIEMYTVMSLKHQEAREFFIKYSDRIVFGTDIMADQDVPGAGARSEIVTRWLTTDDQYGVPAEADYLLGETGSGNMHGLKLPDEVVEKILRGNIQRLFGGEPRKLNAQLAIEECERIAAVAEQMGGTPSIARDCAEVIRGRG